MKKIISAAVKLLTLLFILTTHEAKAYWAASDILEFTNIDDGYNDGDYNGILLIQNNVVYGMFRDGGAAHNGFIYRMNSDGTGFTNLYTFSSTLEGTNPDGALPVAGLIISSNVLYGVAEGGGANGANGLGYGTVFRLNTDGTCFTNLHSFDYTNGADPEGELTIAGNVLYGTTSISQNGQGTIFKVNTDGTGFTTLHPFSPLFDTNNPPNYINTDGATPQFRLTLLGDTLYGTTYQGGANYINNAPLGFVFGTGVIFKCDTNDGSGFQVIYNFSTPTYTDNGFGIDHGIIGIGYTNSDGFSPNVLTAYSNVLYGTATLGGYWGYGTLFKIDTNGNFTLLNELSYKRGYPFSDLAITNNLIFGTLQDAGDGDAVNAIGTNHVYKINTDGTGFVGLSADTSGLALAFGGLALSGHTLYGLGGTNLGSNPSRDISSPGFSQVFTMNLSDSFIGTGSANVPRDFSTATLLPDGTVLVAGGTDPTSGNPISSAELYDPATGTWTSTISMNVARFLHTATLLTNGEVLVAGGMGSSGIGCANAEVYNPATEQWHTTGSMNYGRYAHTATLLTNGQVLVTGGTQAGAKVATAELYDPTTGTWSYTSSMLAARIYHTATLLPDGQVLVAGTTGNYTNMVELYDPSTGTWTTTGPLNVGRGHHTATLLTNGTVLVAGGNNGGGCISNAEVYDPSAGTWTMTGSLNIARKNHTATLLADGNVLVAGGYNFPAEVLSNAEVYVPSSGIWRTATPMSVARWNDTATLLPGGGVLIVGGDDGSQSFDSAEIYYEAFIP